ncbi:hypothetical protein [Roseomonas genomospecies 6]|uniref:Uncharacterized protein n=1 Tax=Roseomonas genomospecies 6 TaxID=214106 RepID=A0A9W7KPF3_9PROT|nr:hypothetical protein [Roseomonas genomospecies 6]KAA0675972.1 hypothetical protein DS843_29045 [Roseomonas genomospecies 6]
MMTVVYSADELITRIEADAVIAVLQPDAAFLTNRLGRQLRDAVWAWSHGDRSPAARQRIEDQVLAAGALGYTVGIGCTDIFTAVPDLDVAVEQGLALMPGFDRPLLRLALQPKASAQRRR